MSKKFMLLIILIIVSLTVCGSLSYYLTRNTTEPHTNELGTKNDNASNSKEHNSKEQDVTSIPLEKPPFVKDK